MNAYDLFSDTYADPISRLLLRLASSKRWSVLSAIGLLAGGVLIFSPGLVSGSCVTFAATWVVMLSTGLATWLAAIAHASQCNATKWSWAIVVLWPLAYLYLWRGFVAKPLAIKPFDSESS